MLQRRRRASALTVGGGGTLAGTPRKLRRAHDALDTLRRSAAMASISKGGVNTATRCAAVVQQKDRGRVIHGVVAAGSSTRSIATPNSFATRVDLVWRPGGADELGIESTHVVFERCGVSRCGIDAHQQHAAGLGTSAVFATCASFASVVGHISGQCVKPKNTSVGRPFRLSQREGLAGLVRQRELGAAPAAAEATCRLSAGGLGAGAAWRPRSPRPPRARRAPPRSRSIVLQTCREYPTRPRA